MKKVLITCAILTLLVGCAAPRIQSTIPKREQKENRFKKQFQQADSMFNEKYGLK